MEGTLPFTMLVHGAWTPPTMYQELMDELDAVGFEVKSPLLPSCDQSQWNETDFSTDVSLVRGKIVSKIEQGRHVIVLMHSYGGAVGTEAAWGLGIIERRERGLMGGVIGLVYMCAFMLQPGQSVRDVTQERRSGSKSRGRNEREKEKEKEKGEKEKGSSPIVFLPQAIKMAFMSDVEPSFVRQTSSSSFTGMNTAAMDGQVTHSTWTTIATTFIKTEKDLAITPEMQDEMIEAARKSGAAVEVETLKTGHTPFITLPSQVAGIVTKAHKRFNAVLSEPRS